MSEFKVGDRVRIISGPCAGVTGTLTELLERTFWLREDSGRVQLYTKRLSPLQIEDGDEKINPLPLVGIGGAPTRATTLPTEAVERKKFPIASGFMDYFPDAVCAVANLSWKGNEQHNPGKALHWDRAKSGDEGDTMLRHFLQRGTLDTDGVRHSAKAAWRAMALLQKELEEAR